MIKCSFGQDEEYVAIKKREYDDLTKTSEDACHAYHEIFRSIDKGWVMTRAEWKKAEEKFHRRPPVKGVCLSMADSYTGGDDVPKALHNPITHLGNRKGLKTTWKHSPKKPIIYHWGQGVDGELNLLHAEGASEGQDSPEDKQTLVGLSLSLYLEASKKFKILGKRKVASSVPGKALPLKVQNMSARASKVAGKASTPLDVDSNSDIHEFLLAKELKDVIDCHLVVAHVTPPSWKQHLMEINIELLCDIHDRAYMRQAVLDNVLNSRTQELIFALRKAKTSYDATRAREPNKDKAYVELERRCNEALQDLDKNPLVFDMRIESERERPKSYEIQLLQEIESLKQDRAAVVSKVIPDAAIKLIHNDDLGVLIAKLVSLPASACNGFLYRGHVSLFFKDVKTYVDAWSVPSFLQNTGNVPSINCFPLSMIIA
nr:hypothetical protein [Tanacetum cinerariifolium]